MTYVVDTHALVWFLEDFAGLGAEAQRVLIDPNSRFGLPTIVLAEARYLAGKQRTDLSWEEIVAAVEADERFTVYPLTVPIIRQMPAEMEMHDAIICATALLLSDSAGESVHVITTDRKMRVSGLVETVW